MRTIHTHVDESQNFSEVKILQVAREYRMIQLYKNLKLAEQNYFLTIWQVLNK